ncbi:hypothetical protein Goari_005817 [Gossypium aridum]|uniref:Uncharacterized protein n=1 Tax=Gossypium aridum TaxID=34290 RepID=A0A7J8XL19_GOSAI|nr:hypothetical protein [Gossypium aridum]
MRLFMCLVQSFLCGRERSRHFWASILVLFMLF